MTMFIDVRMSEPEAVQIHVYYSVRLHMCTLQQRYTQSHDVTEYMFMLFF